MRSYFLVFFIVLIFSKLEGQNTINVEQMVLPLIDNAVLENQHRSNARNVFAESIDVHISPNRQGSWLISDQEAVWYLDIISPNAVSLNLGFSIFHLPANTELTIESLVSHKIFGPFTPADNESHNELWTPIITGDAIRLKLTTTVQKKDQIQLLLTSVNHGFIDITRSKRISRCHLDAVCGTDDGYQINDQYRDQISAVGVISIKGERFCSGVLINNAKRDNIPYFLSAAHCDIDVNNAASVVVYWNYQNSTCRDIDAQENALEGDGQLDLFNTGAIFRAAYPVVATNFDDTVIVTGTDMLLLELDDPISPDANLFFAGWNATDHLPSSSVSIHHPQGLEKRVSINLDPSMMTPLLNTKHLPDFLEVNQWEIGTTDKGSSGGPLFNEKKQVIGSLKSGNVKCGGTGSDWYGWLHDSWEGGGEPHNQLKYWLDPNQTGLLEMTGKTFAEKAFEVEITTIDNVKCSGDQTGSFAVAIIGGQAPFEYQLNGIGESKPGNKFTNLLAGSYYVVVIDDLGEERTTESIEISEPNPISIKLLSNYSEITIKASGGVGDLEYSINGVDYQKNPVFQVEDSGDFTIWVRDEYLCAKSETISISLEPLAVTLILEKGLSCTGDHDAELQVEITGGSQPYRIRLNAGSYNSIDNFAWIGPGTYFVEVKDNANNLLRSNYIELLDPEEIDIKVIPMNNSSIEIHASGGTSPYQFSVNDSPFQTSNHFPNISYGESLVRVKDFNSCELDSMVVIHMVSNLDLVEHSIFRILENPVQDMLRLEIGEDIHFPIQVEIFGINGQGMMSKRFKLSTDRINIPVYNFEEGYYILIMTNSYGLEAEKFIKIK